MRSVYADVKIFQYCIVVTARHTHYTRYHNCSIENILDRILEALIATYKFLKIRLENVVMIKIFGF
jgi:hypothetical protein